MQLEKNVESPHVRSKTALAPLLKQWVVGSLVLVWRSPIRNRELRYREGW
jgi:hypothetical protein